MGGRSRAAPTDVALGIADLAPETIGRAQAAVTEVRTVAGLVEAIAGPARRTDSAVATGVAETISKARGALRAVRGLRAGPTDVARAAQTAIAVAAVGTLGLTGIARVAPEVVRAAPVLQARADAAAVATGTCAPPTRRAIGGGQAAAFAILAARPRAVASAVSVLPARRDADVREIAVADRITRRIRAAVGIHGLSGMNAVGVVVAHHAGALEANLAGAIGVVHARGEGQDVREVDAVAAVPVAEIPPTRLGGASRKARGADAQAKRVAASRKAAVAGGTIGIQDAAAVPG
jgi:hypothetical protein